jgi:hypothetical protein
MPRVGKRKFSYTKRGRKAAKRYARATDGKMVEEKKKKGGNGSSRMNG